jgi:hypothetical protein
MISLAAQSVAAAQTATPMADIHFLAGRWASTSGTVAGTGETARGTSTFTSEVSGAVLLRKDHTEITSASGAAAGSFDQIMLIYPECGILRADYSDGTHIIHYTSATVVPGTSVTFITPIAQDRPAFRLTYRLASPGTLDVQFEMAPPGQTTFHDVATGTLKQLP